MRSLRETFLMEEEVAAKPGRSTLLQRAMSEEEYRSSITCRTEQIKREDIVNVIEALRLVVADTYALIGQAHICHWNVRGPSFFSLHTAFEEQYTELFLAVDEIAERIRAKGALAPGGLSNLSKMAGIDEINEDAAASDMVSHLVTANEKLLADLKIARDLASEEGDSESEDLMIARIQVHEKTVWMLKSYLE